MEFVSWLASPASANTTPMCGVQECEVEHVLVGTVNEKEVHAPLTTAVLEHQISSPVVASVLPVSERGIALVPGSCDPLSSLTKNASPATGLLLSTPIGTNPDPLVSCLISTRAWALMYGTPAARNHHGRPISFIFTSSM